MKTFLSYAMIALFLVSFTSSFSTVPTSAPNAMYKKATGFDYFRLHRQGTNTVLTWSASDAVSFQVERSYDCTFFDVIATVEGGAAKSVKFKDESVFPGTIHYRIAAVKADGSVEYSEIQSVRIVKHG